MGHRNRLGSDEPHRRADGRRDDLVDGADAGVIPALYALVKQWQLRRAVPTVLVPAAPAELSPASAE